MALKQRPCLVCQSLFLPNPRTPQQKVCSQDLCQRERKRRQWRRWAFIHQEQKNRKLRLWAKAYPHYWRHYRKHKAKPAYRQREIQRMRDRRKSLRRVAKQIQIRALYLERLRRIQTLGAVQKNVAKQTLIARRINEIVECLIWKERVAKQIPMEAALALGG